MEWQKYWQYPTTEWFCPKLEKMISLSEAPFVQDLSCERYCNLENSSSLCEKALYCHIHAEEVLRLKELERERLAKSLDVARELNQKSFHEMCSVLDREMFGSKRWIGEPITFSVTIEDAYIIYLFVDGKVKEITKGKNFVDIIYKRASQYGIEKGIEVSYRPLKTNEETAELVVLQLKVMNRIPSAYKQVRYDNPIYVTDAALYKYVKASYGMDTYEFKRILKNHSELTVIDLKDGILYMKEEIDEIIRRDSFVG